VVTADLKDDSVALEKIVAESEGAGGSMPIN